MSADAVLARRIIANDLRLFFRGLQRKKWRAGASLLGQILLVGVFHIVAFTVLNAFTESKIRGGAEFACLILALFVLSAGFHRSLEVLYNRGDLPLLLSSPVPPRIVVWTRLSDIMVTTLLSTAAITIPVINMATLMIDRAWAWGWIAWVCAVALLTPFALWLTIECVGRLGARRARSIVQIFSLAITVLAVLLVNAQSLFVREDAGSFAAAQARFFEWFAVPPLSGLAAAARGNLLWLAALAALPLIVVRPAVRRLEHEFIAGAQDAASDLGGRSRKPAASTALAWQGAFAGSRWRSFALKELRLVRRDPLLIMRCFLQLVLLLPMLAGAFFYKTTAGFASFAFIGPTLIALLLATLMKAGDEAAELVATSPLEPRQEARARVAAASLLPALIAWLVAAIIAILGAPLVALFTALAVTWQVIAFSWLGACVPTLSAEDRANLRQVKSGWQTFYAMAVGGLGAGAAALFLSQSQTAGTIMLLVSLGAASLAFLAEPRRLLM